MDDMIATLRALTPAERKLFAANLDEQGAAFDRPRIHLALKNAENPDALFRERSEACCGRSAAATSRGSPMAHSGSSRGRRRTPSATVYSEP